MNIGHYGDWAVKAKQSWFGGQQWQGLITSPPHADSSWEHVVCLMDAVCYFSKRTVTSVKPKNSFPSVPW